MKQKNYPVTNIGSSSILVIFIVLCLVTFGTLSIATSNRDYKQSRMIADRTTAYYEASNRAEQILTEVDPILNEYLQTDPEQMKVSLADLGITMTGTDTLQFFVPIDDSQQLEVGLTLHAPSAEDDSYYSVTCWKSVRTEQWNGDSKLHLM